MSRFPGRGMKQMRQAFPKASHFVQVRLFGQDGSHVTVEGPITREEYQEIFAHAIGKDPVRRVALAALVDQAEQAESKKEKPC